MLYLKEIEISDGIDVYKMFQEIPSEELGSENLANGLTLKEFKKHKNKLVENAKGHLLGKNETQKINYIFYDKGYPVGSIALRLKLNEYWHKHSGHIGFSIRPSERGKGYGTKMLGLALQKAKEKGFKEVFLQCNNKNYSSQKVIEANGGKKTGENGSIKYVINLEDSEATKKAIKTVKLGSKPFGVPMVIILSGLPGSGKSYLSEYLHKKYGFSVLSGENITHSLYPKEKKSREEYESAYKF